MKKELQLTEKLNLSENIRESDIKVKIQRAIIIIVVHSNWMYCTTVMSSKPSRHKISYVAVCEVFRLFAILNGEGAVKSHWRMKSARLHCTEVLRRADVIFSGAAVSLFGMVKAS